MAQQHIVNTRKDNTNKRYALIKASVDETYSKKNPDGLSPDYDEVLDKVAKQYGIAPRTVKNILKMKEVN